MSFAMRPLRFFAMAAVLSLAVGLLLLVGSVAGVFKGTAGVNFMVASGAMLFGVLTFFLVLVGLLCELVLKTGNIKDLSHLKARTE